MKHFYKTGVTLAVSAFSLILVGNISAADTSPKTISLKSIMQGLLADTQQITEGMFLDNFKMIEKAASNIAAHPEVPKSTKMKLMKSFGAKMANFKAFDMVVHDAAVEIAKAASVKDMNAVLSQYQQMISACQSCHNNFKKKAQDILK